MHRFLVPLFLGLSTATAHAQGPAEAPPADFAAKNYVDSKGCMFLKAGVSGSTVWAPLIGVDGKPVCGREPSVKPKAVAAEPAPAPKAAAKTEAKPAKAPEPAAAPAKSKAKEAPSKPAPAAKPAPTKPEKALTGRWVQVGAYKSPANSERAVAALGKLGFGATTHGVRNGSLIAVLAGPFSSADEQAAALAKLRAQGFPGAFVR